MVLSTPVIIVSNGDCIPDNEIFNSRLTKFEWTAIDVSNYVPIYIEEEVPDNAVHAFYTKAVHPEAFVAYWKKHNIWNQKYLTCVMKK